MGNKEELKQQMDYLADLETKRDLIVADRETLKKNLIPIEIQAEMESVDYEFENQILEAENQIDQQKKALKSALEASGESVKSQYYGYTYEEVPEWNASALDGYALEHPEILWMRTTKKKTRLYPIKGK